MLTIPVVRAGGTLVSGAHSGSQHRTPEPRTISGPSSARASQPAASVHQVRALESALPQHYQYRNHTGGVAHTLIEYTGVVVLTRSLKLRNTQLTSWRCEAHTTGQQSSGGQLAAGNVITRMGSHSACAHAPTSRQAALTHLHVESDPVDALGRHGQRLGLLLQRQCRCHTCSPVVRSVMTHTVTSFPFLHRHCTRTTPPPRPSASCQDAHIGCVRAHGVGDLPSRHRRRPSSCCRPSSCPCPSSSFHPWPLARVWQSAVGVPGGAANEQLAAQRAVRRQFYAC